MAPPSVPLHSPPQTRARPRTAQLFAAQPRAPPPSARSASPTPPSCSSCTTQSHAHDVCLNPTPERLLFIHGGGDDGYGADSKLADSLREKLGEKYKVTFPRMPEPGFDSSETWPAKIHKAVATYKPTFLVGHSFGASNLLQYLVRYGSP